MSKDSKDVEREKTREEFARASLFVASIFGRLAALAPAMGVKPVKVVVDSKGAIDLASLEDVFKESRPSYRRGETGRTTDKIDTNQASCWLRASLAKLVFGDKFPEIRDRKVAEFKQLDKPKDWLHGVKSTNGMIEVKINRLREWIDANEPTSKSKEARERIEFAKTVLGDLETILVPLSGKKYSEKRKAEPSSFADQFDDFNV